MSKQRRDLLTVTYNPKKGIPAALLGAIITHLPDDAQITEILVSSTTSAPEVAELALNYTYTPEW